MLLMVCASLPYGERTVVVDCELARSRRRDRGQGHSEASDGEHFEEDEEAVLLVKASVFMPYLRLSTHLWIGP